MKKTRIAMFGLVVATVFMATAAMAGDKAIFPGVNCTTSAEILQTFWRGGVGYGDWKCPVPTRNSSNSVASIKVRVRDRNGNEKIICRFYNVSATSGAQTALGRDETAWGVGTGTDTLSIYLNPGEADGAVYFQCNVPADYNGTNSRLMSYEVNYF